MIQSRNKKAKILIEELENEARHLEKIGKMKESKTALRLSVKLDAVVRAFNYLEIRRPKGMYHGSN